MGQDAQKGTDFTSVLLVSADLGLQNRLREELSREQCALLALASLDEAGKAAAILHFDRIILDASLGRQPGDLAEFTLHLEPGQKLILLQDPDRIVPEAGLNPRCRIRSVTRTAHAGILLARLRTALAGGPQVRRFGDLTTQKVSVLLVDPDPIAQDLVLHTLMSQGYLVLSIPNPVEAGHTAQDIFFDVLMVDALLPLGGARKLAKALSAINPRLKVLFLSNHPTEILTTSGVCPMGAQVLRKPLRRREILDSLDSVAGGPEWNQLLAGAGSRLPVAKPVAPEDVLGPSESA